VRRASKPSPSWPCPRSSASVCTKSMCFDGRLSWSTFDSKMTIKLLTEHKITPVRNIYRLMGGPMAWIQNECCGQFENQGRRSHIGPNEAGWWDVIFLSTRQTWGLHLSIHKGDRELKEVLKLPLTRGYNPFAPFRKSPSWNPPPKEERLQRLVLGQALSAQSG